MTFAFPVLTGVYAWDVQLEPMPLVACCLLSVPLARRISLSHIRSEIHPCFHVSFRGGSRHLIADCLARGGLETPCWYLRCRKKDSSSWWTIVAQDSCFCVLKIGEGTVKTGWGMLMFVRTLYHVGPWRQCFAGTANTSTLQGGYLPIHAHCTIGIFSVWRMWTRSRNTARSQRSIGMPSMSRRNISKWQFWPRHLQTVSLGNLSDCEQQQ